MCLAIPAEILECNLEQDRALVSIGQVKKEVSLSLVENVGVGDFVLLHVGFAIAKVDRDEAEKTLKLFEETGMLVQESDFGGE